MNYCKRCRHYKRQQQNQRFFLGDEHSHGPQFSKVITLMAIIIEIAGIIFATVASFKGMSDTVCCTIITACGCIGVTATVYNYKKSQAENTVKLYLSSYKEIMELKEKYNEDSSTILDEMEDNMMNKMGTTIDVALDNATSPIERQNIY